MQSVGRPVVAAGIACLVAATVAALPAVPAAPVLSRLASPDLRLTAGLSELLATELDVNSSLITGVLQLNDWLVDGERAVLQALTPLLGGTVDAAGVHGLVGHGLEQFFDGNNALLGIGETSLLGMFGARGTPAVPLDLVDLNASLITDTKVSSIQASMPFAGLESVVDHYFGAVAFIGAELAGLTEDDLENGSTEQGFTTLVPDVAGFNAALFAAEQNFGGQLGAAEVQLEQAMFGTDSALNGVVNRLFNTVNLMFDGPLQSFNGLIGLTAAPRDLTAALIVGGDQTFNDGSVGGLTGMADQALVALADLGGLLNGDGIATPGGFAPDVAAVGEALRSLAETLLAGPFGDVFAPDGEFATVLGDLPGLLGL